MQDVLRALEENIRHGNPVAYTALVETRGSTPQKAGAVMLVFPDGSQTGTLGGGCVEAEVKRRALRLLDQGQREILTFQLDNDYGWDDGLICGGRMRMLVDPVRPGDDPAYYRRLIEIIRDGKGCTEAVVIDPDKAGSAGAGDRYLLDADGNLLAARTSQTGPPRGAAASSSPAIPESRAGGSSVETSTPASSAAGVFPAAVVENLKPLVRRPRAYVTAGVSYLPRLERCRLLIVGAGHVGQKVAELAAEADFDVWVVDDREQYCNPERFPQASRLIVDTIDTALSGLEVDEHTYCVIVTRGHNHDEEALYHVAEKPARYVGMIGSKRKIKLIFEDLLREGISRDALARVYAPLGFDIGSQTVPEIAVSIVAELIAHRNLGEIPERVRSQSVVEEIKESPAGKSAD